MPLVDFDDPAVWVWLYGHPFDVEHDHWCYGNDVERLIAALPRGARVAVIGAALGFGVKKMIEAGLDAYGFDTSQFFADKKKHVEIDTRNILTDDIGQYDYVLTEDLLATLPDREAVAMSKACRKHGKAIHWISTGTRRHDNATVWSGDARLNWKTLEDWKALVAPDLVVERQTGRVL